MKKLENIYIEIENPSVREKFILLTYNFLLWYITKIFKNDKEKMKKEIGEVTKKAYYALRNK